MRPRRNPRSAKLSDENGVAVDEESVESAAIEHVAVPGMRGPSPFLRLQSDERLVAADAPRQPGRLRGRSSRATTRACSPSRRHMLGSREDAEDVLQEIFAAAYNAMVADDRADQRQARGSTGSRATAR